MKLFLHKQVTVWLKDSDLCVQAYVVGISTDDNSGAIDVYLSRKKDGEPSFFIPYDNILLVELFDGTSSSMKSKPETFVATTPPEQTVQAWQGMQQIEVHDVEESQDSIMSDTPLPHDSDVLGFLLDEAANQPKKKRGRKKKQSDVLTQQVGDKEPEESITTP